MSQSPSSVSSSGPDSCFFVSPLTPFSSIVQEPCMTPSLQLQHETVPCQDPLSYSSELQETSRRSGNYHPTLWDHDFIESTQSPYSDGKYKARLEELKLQVKMLFDASKEPFAQLELIDAMQRLGVAYHFEKEIRDTLDQVHVNDFYNLYAVALCFRLLRQHGCNVSSDLIGRFKDTKEGFKKCLSEGVKGLLSLYEASHLATPEEKVLEEAKEFSVRHLKALTGQVEKNLAKQVRHSLEIPLHMGIPRLEARYYIDVYEGSEGMNSVLLELAKLDFNVVQSMYLMEIKELSRWWKDLAAVEKLEFIRDRLVENYLWSAGAIAFEPQFSKCRLVLTKLACIITILDDIYDLYGSLEELKLFTSELGRWDLKATENLPEYMRLCYLALYNFVNETASDILNDHAWDAMPLIKREWERQCKAYLVEAEWFHKGYAPNLEEYMENASTSIAVVLAMIHLYLFVVQTLNEDSINSLEQGSKMIYWSSFLTRLCDDLGTSKGELERGDTLKSVECHMKETGESEESSREYVKSLAWNSWMELNKECLKAPLPQSFINMTLNMARVARCIYWNGDGMDSSKSATKDWITSLFFEHIHIE